MSLQFDLPSDHAVFDGTLSSLTKDAGYDAKHKNVSRDTADLPTERVVHIVRITITEERIFRMVLALANVIEANLSNSWTTVHGAWEGSARSCVTLRFDQAYSPVRLALELKRIAVPRSYRFLDAKVVERDWRSGDLSRTVDRDMAR